MHKKFEQNRTKIKGAISCLNKKWPDILALFPLLSHTIIQLEHRHNKFEINRTKIKGGCQTGRKVVTHNCKSDLNLVALAKLALKKETISWHCTTKNENIGPAFLASLSFPFRQKYVFPELSVHLTKLTLRNFYLFTC